MGGREGSYSAPGGHKGGPRKGLRRAEEVAVSVLEKISKKEDKIKEWGPQIMVPGSLKKSPKEGPRCPGKGPQREPMEVRED
jgi:hypothetical protein